MAEERDERLNNEKRTVDVECPRCGFTARLDEEDIAELGGFPIICPECEGDGENVVLQIQND